MPKRSEHTKQIIENSATPVKLTIHLNMNDALALKWAVKLVVDVGTAIGHFVNAMKAIERRARAIQRRAE